MSFSGVRNPFRSWGTGIRSIILLAVVFIFWRTFIRRASPDTLLPPLYPWLDELESKLPQHNPDLPPPEGKNGRFIRFQNQMWGVGFNNQLQELLLNSHIAHLANRAYVFAPFTWDIGRKLYVPQDNGHFSNSTFALRAARTPLTAFISGPAVGGPWAHGDPTPRSISLKWWDHICPPNRRLELDPGEINPTIGVDLLHDEGSVIVEKWAKYLKDLDASCVNIMWAKPRIIDFDLLGSTRLLSLWPTYSKSPVLTRFGWSDIVQSAVQANAPVLTGLSSRVTSKDSLHPKEGVIPGLVTLHLRRGDYKKHCEWISTFVIFEGWNNLDFLPDRFNPPATPKDHPPNTPPPRDAYAFNRCWIEIPRIVSRLEELRKEHPDEKLDKVFLSTNGDIEWIEQVKKVLKTKGWKHVSSTKDLSLDWEQQGVDNAIDMELASRGSVFVSNGFSSFSSTVVRLRLVRGLPAGNIRFW